MIKRKKTQIKQKPNKEYTTFALNLKGLRAKYQMTQECFCEEVGCSTRTLSRWEHGIHYPTMIYRPLIQNIFPKIGQI